MKYVYRFVELTKLKKNKSFRDKGWVDERQV